MIPVAKNFVWERDDEDLVIVLDPRNCLVVADADGQVERLLVLLREGGRTPAQIAQDLGEGVTQTDVDNGLAVLDAHRLIEAEPSTPMPEADGERYFSNLAFFESFADIASGSADYQERLRSAHVLVLGTGGLNSNTIPHLCGLGVGRLTLVDRDRVEVRNFARQYLYQQAQVGESKVEAAADWVRRFDPAIKVRSIQMSIDGTDTVAELLEQYRPDVVMHGADSPRGIDLWVNDACVAAGVPMVRAGMAVTTGSVWSVDPGNSACRRCLEVEAPTVDGDVEDISDRTNRLYLSLPRRNRGIGPIAGLLGSLSAFEVLRYLTGFEPPAYAGAPLHIDFAASCDMTRLSWQREDRCPTCGGR